METEYIVIKEYIDNTDIEPQFIVLLEEEGLINTQWIDGTQYLSVSQLNEIERYANLYYDLSINIEGIGAIQHLLQKMKTMEHELIQLRKIMGYYKSEDSFDFDNDLFN